MHNIWYLFQTLVHKANKKLLDKTVVKQALKEYFSVANPKIY